MRKLFTDYFPGCSDTSRQGLYAELKNMPCYVTDIKRLPRKHLVTKDDLVLNMTLENGKKHSKCRRN